MIARRWLGRVPYAATLEAQRAFREEVIHRRAPETLWGLEHEPVITTGRRAESAPDPERVRAAGFALVATERGGLATCHEPGQLVGYVFLDAHTLGVRRLVEALEEGIIAWLAAEGVSAGRREGYPGIWLGRDKVCAIGLHVRQGVTMHGFALNLDNDLRGFGLITPCGITDGGVTTLARARGAAPTPEQAWPSVADAVTRAVSEARAGSGLSGPAALDAPNPPR